jgi:hypothetical protein
MSTTADLSVVMPTYKHAQYLPRALKALLTQSVRPREVVVVNDASPDETAQVLENFSHDAAIKIIHNDRNRGTNESARIGLAAVQGKYLYVTASDDYVLPGFVEKMVGTLEQHPRAGLCCAWFSVVNEASGEVRPNPSRWCDSARYFSPADLEPFIGHASIPGHATILRRSSFSATGGFLSDLHWHSDWFVNFVVAFRDGICHVPEMLALLTEAPHSYSAEGARSAKEVSAIDAIFNRLLSADYGDVAPYFERSGVLSVFGPPVLRAAAARDDAWTRPILSLVNCLTTEEYEALADDPEPRVRELAALFLGRFWRKVRQKRQHNLEETARAEASRLLAELRATIDQQQQELTLVKRQLSEALQTTADREAKIHHLDLTATHLSQVIERMESSYFWRCRKLLATCKPRIRTPMHKT